MADRRPDLEAQSYKTPGFIGMRLFPALKRMVKAGTIYFQDIVSDGSAQTDRTLASAPTATAIASASTTWSMAEKIKRYKIDQSEIEQLGGLDNAQQKAARLGKRAVMGAVEALAIAATFGDQSNITTVDILDSFLKTLDVAKETIQDYADGTLALFGARRIIGRLKRYDEVVERMKFTGVLPGSVRDVRSISDQQLAAALGVDEILAGPSTGYWLGGSNAYDGVLGLAVLPDPNTDPDEEIQIGRTLAMPVPVDGSADNIFQVETYYSDDLRSEVCDTVAWISLEVFNKEPIYLMTGIDEENAVTTTTAA